MIVESVITSQILAFLKSSIALRLNDELMKRIKSEGLYHITQANNLDKIMKGSIAQLKPSNMLNSYSNLFQKSVFMFGGKPNGFDIIYNMKVNELNNFKVIHIPPEEVKSLIDENRLKFREIDNAVMHKGVLTANAKVYDLKDIVSEKEIARLAGMTPLQSILHRAIEAIKAFGRMNIATYIEPVRNIASRALSQGENEIKKPVIESIKENPRSEVIKQDLKRGPGDLQNENEILKKVINLYKDSFPAIKHICKHTAKAIDNIIQENGGPLSVQDIRKVYKEAGRKYEADPSVGNQQEFCKYQKAIDGLNHAQLSYKQEQIRQTALQNDMIKTKAIELVQ